MRSILCSMSLSVVAQKERKTYRRRRRDILRGVRFLFQTFSRNDLPGEAALSRGRSVFKKRKKNSHFRRPYKIWQGLQLSQSLLKKGKTLQQVAARYDPSTQTARKVEKPIKAGLSFEIDGRLVRQRGLLLKFRISSKVYGLPSICPPMKRIVKIQTLKTQCVKKEKIVKQLFSSG